MQQDVDGGDAGAHTFTTGVQLKTTGTWFVKVADTVTATLNGQQSGIVVNPGAFRSCRSASRKSASIRPSCTVCDPGSPAIQYENIGPQVPGKIGLITKNLGQSMSWKQRWRLILRWQCMRM